MKKIIRWTSILPALCTATLLAGCGSTGVGDILGGGSDRDTTTTNRNDPYEQRIDNVRGTVRSVDTRNRTIVVDVEDANYRNDLRNGNDGDEVVLEYDDSTTVEYQGKTFQPEDLERGDRILAEVDQSGLSASRMRVDEIQVLTDATSGSRSTGAYGDDDDDYRTANGDLRGTVRYIDTRNRTLEIETSSRSFSTSNGSSGVVTVYYDAETTVEFEGRRYQPENIERGDEVEVDTRTVGGRLMAEEIQVVGDSRSSR